MNGNDEQEAAKTRVGEIFDEIEGTLETQIQESADSGGSSGLKKGQEAASMSSAADGVRYSLTSYLKEPDQDFLDTASTSAGDFVEALTRFEKLSSLS